MKILDLTFASPAQNLSCDEVLLDLCDNGFPHEILRFWSPASHFVVLGYSNNAEAEVHTDFCRANNIPVFKRCSGGGTVLQGPGCLNYSLVLALGNGRPMGSISLTNDFIMGTHRRALRKLLGPEISVKGDTDLALRELKFSGNSQRRKRKALLFHGTFLLNFDLTLIGRSLKMPSRRPAYRQDRPHEKFLMNLKCPASKIKEALKKAWGAQKPLENIPFENIDKLAASRYSPLA